MTATSSVFYARLVSSPSILSQELAQKHNEAESLHEETASLEGRIKKESLICGGHARL